MGEVRFSSVWEVAPGPTGWDTTDPVLFIYWTADKYTTTGCYNAQCAGFVQTNSEYIFLQSLQPYSTTRNPNIGISIEWQLNSGNWWFSINGDNIGYYPTLITMEDNSQMMRRTSNMAERLTLMPVVSGYWGFRPRGVWICCVSERDFLF
jgi:Neprosin